MYYPTLLRSEARALLEAGAQLVDVRNPREHRQHALPGSINIPLPVIRQALKQLDKETPVLLYCASGQRSGTARRLLEACGFRTVHNIGTHAFMNDCDWSHSQ
ncbi:MAG: rhodanese-like domain-containing protein [Gammaproteobacteria bacterium]